MRRGHASSVFLLLRGRATQYLGRVVQETGHRGHPGHLSSDFARRSNELWLIANPNGQPVPQWPPQASDPYQSADRSDTARGQLCRPSETVLELLPMPQRGEFRKEDGELVVDSGRNRVS